MSGLIDATFAASYKNARARSMTAEFDTNSPNCYNVRSPGRITEKLVTLTASGNPVFTNLFIVTGLVRLNDIIGIFMDVTNVVDIENVSLDTTDAGVSPPLTLAAGPVCDGATLGSSLVKIGAADVALAFMNGDQVRVEETTKRQNLDPILINAKYGTTTYIRLLYKSVANLNCQIRFQAEWRSYCGSTGLVVPA